MVHAAPRKKHVRVGRELEDGLRVIAICYLLLEQSTMIWQTTAILDKRIISVFRFAIHDKARAIISVPVLNLRHGISKNLPADELTTPSGAHYSYCSESR